MNRRAVLGAGLSLGVLGRTADVSQESPQGPPQSPVGVTADTPVPFGQSIGIYDYAIVALYQAGDVTELVMGYGDYIGEPSRGKIYTAFGFDVTYLGATTGEPYRDLEVFAINKDGVGYQADELAMEYVSPAFRRTLFPNTSITHVVPFEIYSEELKDMTGCIVAGADAVPIYFDMGPVGDAD